MRRKCKIRVKKLTALFLALTVTLLMTNGVYASEVSADGISYNGFEEDEDNPDDVVLFDSEKADSEDTAEEPAEESEKTAGTTGTNGVTEAMKVATKIRSIVATIDGLEAGVDYADRQGVFRVKTKEEAEKIASEYDAELVSYKRDIAVIRFKDSVIDSLTNAANAQKTVKVVEPNYISHLADAKLEPYNKFDSTVKAADDKNVIDSGELETDIDAAKAPDDPWADKKADEYQWFHDKINTLAAHETTTGEGITVAVIDTGLSDTALMNDFSDGTEKDRTENATYFGTENDDDLSGHGTNCAGSVGCTKDNATYGYGVACDADVYAINAYTYDSDGEGFYNSDVWEAIEMAEEKGCQVISMSLGGYYYSDEYQEVITEAAQKGITIVAAAGNECTNEAHYPSSYDNVISVAASDSKGELASFSNYGDNVDIVAPGGNIKYKGKQGYYADPIYGPPAPEAFEEDDDGTITYPYTSSTPMCGTSQATPQVAGVVALMYAANPTFTKTKTIDTPEAITEILLSTTDGNEYVYDDHSVTGLVQADLAVEAAASYSSTYTMVNSGGNYAVFNKDRIAQGSSFKLEIGDAAGNTKAVKSLTKTAVWASSNPALVSVNKGKVKCAKTATLWSKVDITATIGSEKVKCTLTVVPKFKFFGNVSYKIGHRGVKYLFKSSVDMTATTTGRYNLANPYYYTSGAAVLVVDKKKGGLYAPNSLYSYKITIPKKQLAGITVIEYSKNGSPKVVKFSAGKYKIKWKIMCGINKTFTQNLTVS